MRPQSSLQLTTGRRDLWHRFRPVQRLLRAYPTSPRCLERGRPRKVCTHPRGVCLRYAFTPYRRSSCAPTDAHALLHPAIPTTSFAIPLLAVAPTPARYSETAAFHAGVVLACFLVLKALPERRPVERVSGIREQFRSVVLHNAPTPSSCSHAFHSRIPFPASSSLRSLRQPTLFHTRLIPAPGY